eukprot:GCRY01000435.1.p1 GENE.GCRY01000435.1~~GCRY01000435.1.p1  ORF type:complete len:200 (+),score=40.24 GCRY01000435.1:136-735(+)
MVSFVCDECGATVKKPKAVNHMRSCRSTVSCIDCYQTFDQRSVVGHTSCISEAEKYQGKLYRGPKKQNNQTTGNAKNSKTQSNQNTAPPTAPQPETKPEAAQASSKKEVKKTDETTEVAEKKKENSSDSDSKALKKAMKKAIVETLEKNNKSLELKKLQKLTLKSVRGFDKTTKTKKKAVFGKQLKKLKVKIEKDVASL